MLSAPQACDSDKSLRRSRMRLRRLLVEHLGLDVRVMVAQVGADHDQGFRPAPDRLERTRHLFRRRQSDGDRQQVEVTEQRLQERHLHLE